MATDRKALLRALQELEDDAFVVLTGQIDDQDHGHEIAAELTGDLGDDFSYVFLHRQTAQRCFHANGSMREPAALHWGGDHDALVERLAYLAEPWIVYDFGPDQAFMVSLPELEEEEIELPAFDAPRAEIATAAAQLLDADEFDEEAEAWLVGVFAQTEPKTRAKALDLATKHLDRPAVKEAVLAAWPDAYRAYGDSAPVARLLKALHRDGDERFDAVLAEAEKQRAWSFRWDAAEILGEFRPPKALARLRKLATASDDRYGRVSNPPAVRQYIAVLADEESISLVEAAERVALDEDFAPGAQQEAVREIITASDSEPWALRSVRGALNYLRTGHGTPELRRQVFAQGADERHFIASGAEPDVGRQLVLDLLEVADNVDDVPGSTLAALQRRADELSGG